MSKTVLSSFSEFASNLNVTDRQEKVVSTCRENVVNTIKKELTLHSEQNSKLIGSYDRNTLIRYLSENDVDVMVVLHYSENKGWETPEGTVTALNKFKSILTAAYPKTDMRIDRNCVTMKLSEFTLDVVPAFRYSDGTYRIPDTYRQQWLSTNPVEFSKKISELNKNMGSTFIPLIKMVKGWNRENGFIIRSFHLECMLFDHYKNYVEGYSYDSTLQVFFSKLPFYLGSSCYDPVTIDRLDEYLDNNSIVTDRDKAIEKAKKAAEISKRARDYSDNYPSNPEYSINEWKKLLGEFFPTYG